MRQNKYVYSKSKYLLKIKVNLQIQILAIYWIYWILQIFGWLRNVTLEKNIKFIEFITTLSESWPLQKKNFKHKLFYLTGMSRFHH